MDLTTRGKHDYKQFTLIIPKARKAKVAQLVEQFTRNE